MGGQSAELRKNNQSRCAAMRASPMWRPGHYRMRSSCLDSLRHEIFHQTKAEVRGSRRERSEPLRARARGKVRSPRRSELWISAGGRAGGEGGEGGWKPIQKLIPDLKPWRDNPSEITHFRRWTCWRPWNTEAVEQDGTQKKKHSQAPVIPLAEGKLRLSNGYLVESNFEASWIPFIYIHIYI